MSKRARRYINRSRILFVSHDDSGGFVDSFEIPNSVPGTPIYLFGSISWRLKRNNYSNGSRISLQ